MFSLSLYEELKEKVDVLAVLPSFTRTPLTVAVADKMWESHDAEESVRATLLGLGQDAFTFGAPKHRIAGRI